MVNFGFGWPTLPHHVYHPNAYANSVAQDRGSHYIMLLVFYLVTLLQELLVISIWNVAGASKNSNSMLLRELSNEATDYVRSPSTICRNFPGMTRQQFKLCRRLPDVTAAAIEGIENAVSECQHQLRHRRWNCSSLSTKNGNPYTHEIMRRGYRETALAYAMIAGSVLYHVTRSCSMGKLRACGCDTRYSGSEADFEWGGCSHDITFGERFAVDFLDSRERGSDPNSQMNLHNNKAGRIAVARYAEKKCKCHGMSGSCELKTCWMQTPKFRDVGDRLKEKFHSALRMHIHNGITGKLELKRGNRRGKRKKPAPLGELIFLERSPDFCNAVPDLGIDGTQGRYCNRTSTGTDGCDSMCCGRGYNIRLETRTEWCNCTFHWCCFVKCAQCHSTHWVNTCK